VAQGGPELRARRPHSGGERPQWQASTPASRRNSRRPRRTPVNFAILTTKANEAVAHIHDRMPVILPLSREKNWLQPNPTGQFFMPEFPPELLTSYPVTHKVNKATFNSPEAILPLEPTIT
jgi:putative SOS response-associated peptidase YedK